MIGTYSDSIVADATGKNHHAHRGLKPIGIYTSQKTRFRPGGTPDISRWWNHRDRVRPTSQPRRGDRPDLVCRPSGAERTFGPFPVVPPPANIRCASGTKTCVDTNGFQPLVSREYSPVADATGEFNRR
jgi:hypothetical protein